MNKIAIVDDVKLMHSLLRIILDEKKFEILESYSGQGALDLLVNNEGISVLFLDLMMSDMDGFQVLEAINSPSYQAKIVKNHPNLKIVLMTSNDNQDIRNKAFRLGAAFFVSKPFKKAEIQKIVCSATLEKEKKSDLTVLVAEDSSLTRSIVTSVLKAFHVNIIEANDGDVAYDYLKKHPGEVDLVISDLLMERMNGDVLAEKIRNELSLLHLPIIILTSIDEKSTVLDLFKLGITDYVYKPFIVEEFTSKMKVHFQNILLTKRLQKTINEQQQLLELKDEFLSVCSHDLRAPLSAILGFADIVNEQLSCPEQKVMMEHISSSGNYLLGLINNILDLGKTTIKKSTENFIDINLADVIDYCVDTLQASAKKKSINLSVKHLESSRKLKVRGDEVSLIRIFTNLISNALKFTEKNGRVFIQLRQSFDKVELSIQDNGIGIAEDKIPILFQKYTAASQSGTDGEKSTGLGMSIVKRLVEIHEGDISIASKLGEGTTITVSFPLLGEQDQSQKTLNLDDEFKKDVDIAGKRILVIDDNSVNLSLVEKILTRSKAIAEGFSMPMEALNRYEQAQTTKPFDIILMDLEMPEMNGFELTEYFLKLHETYDWPQAPIIALTAHQNDSITQSVKDAGMVDIVHKPINKIQLVQKIHQYSQS